MEINKIYNLPCLEMLIKLPDNSIDCCVTSPPYYGLRDYGHDGQLGLEATPEAYVEKMVAVFREVRRVIKDDGTLWLNLGDSYSSHKDCKSIGQTIAAGTSREHAHEMELGKSRVRDSKMLKSQGYKNKDLIGIPWMVAFALRADGWYLRQDIIWHKPNPMPESVTDRCTKAHEYIFLLTKNERYIYDAEAIREPSDGAWLSKDKRYQEGVLEAKRDADEPSFQARLGKPITGLARKHTAGRNKRSVWTVNGELDLVQIRKDLTTEERRYVVDELIRRGLL